MLRFLTAGESHGPTLVVTLDGMPAGLQLDVPALVISGEMDIPSFMMMAEAYARTLPRARREIIQAAGHLANIERADQWNALLRDFLKDI